MENGEKISVDPLRQELHEANDKFAKGEKVHERELINRIGVAIQTTIESPKKSTDPLAPRLSRVVRKDKGPEGISILTYYLKSSEALQQQTGIDVIRQERTLYEERGQIDGGYVIDLRDAPIEENTYAESPYEERPLMDSYRTSVSLRPGEEKQRFFTHLEKVYEDIQAHGVQTDLNEIVILQPQTKEPFEPFQNYVKNLPFTGSLLASPG